MHDSGWLIFKFESESAMIEVLNRGPYSVYGRLLILKTMPDYFDFDTSDMIRMPVWVRFPNLPLQCLSPLCLSKLASVIGKPVHSDSPTTSTTRLSYARMLIDIDLLVELPSSIDITLPNGVTKSQAVINESLPRFCKQCKTLGHSTSACNKAFSHKRKKSPPLPLLPLDALIPQLTLKQLKNSQPGRKFKVNQQWTQWLLRQLWLLTRVQAFLYVSGQSWLYKQDPLMLLLALLKSFRYLKIALQLPQHRLQGGNT
jgi:hypothetical protein